MPPPVAVGEQVDAMLAEVAAFAERAVPIVSAHVSQVYTSPRSSGGAVWHRVTVSIEGAVPHMAFAPRFAAAEDAAAFRAGAAELVARLA